VNELKEVKEGKGREGKGREGKGREGKGREKKGTERNGNGTGRENKPVLDRVPSGEMAMERPYSPVEVEVTMLKLKNVY
jgi:hypothetical protein